MRSGLGREMLTLFALSGELPSDALGSVHWFVIKYCISDSRFDRVLSASSCIETEVAYKKKCT